LCHRCPQMLPAPCNKSSLHSVHTKLVCTWYVAFVLTSPRGMSPRGIAKMCTSEASFSRRQSFGKALRVLLELFFSFFSSLKHVLGRVLAVCGDALSPSFF
jgi:hypothetical protein